MGQELVVGTGWSNRNKMFNCVLDAIFSSFLLISLSLPVSSSRYVVSSSAKGILLSIFSCSLLAVDRESRRLFRRKGLNRAGFSPVIIPGEISAVTTVSRPFRRRWRREKEKEERETMTGGQLCLVKFSVTTFPWWLSGTTAMPAFRVAFDTGKGGREGSLVLKGADRGKLFFARGEWRTTQYPWHELEIGL